MGEKIVDLLRVPPVHLEALLTLFFLLAACTSNALHVMMLFRRGKFPDLRP